MSIQSNISKCQAYLDKVAALEVRHRCRHGHVDCAAWESGPCSIEVEQQKQRMIAALTPTLAGRGSGFAVLTF
jgi:hypothetical protein